MKSNKSMEPQRLSKSTKADLIGRLIMAYTIVMNVSKIFSKVQNAKNYSSTTCTWRVVGVTQLRRRASTEHLLNWQTACPAVQLKQLLELPTRSLSDAHIFAVWLVPFTVCTAFAYSVVCDDRISSIAIV